MKWLVKFIKKLTTKREVVTPLDAVDTLVNMSEFETVPELASFECSGCFFSFDKTKSCSHPHATDENKNVSFHCTKNHTIFVKK